MILIIGLGNPGPKFKNTPHNIGFEAIKKFAEENNFPEFKLDKKLNSLISEKPFDTTRGIENVILAKPQTFMNESGRAVKKLIENCKLKIENCVVVVHDDIDLPLGEIKIVKNRGSAGHKGVESIIKHLGTEDFTRLRIGIQPPAGKPKAAEKFVLKKMDIPKEVIEKSVNALDLFLKEGLDRAMNEYNQ